MRRHILTSRIVYAFFEFSPPDDPGTLLRAFEQTRLAPSKPVEQYDPMNGRHANMAKAGAGDFDPVATFEKAQGFGAHPSWRLSLMRRRFAVCHWPRLLKSL